ncbi:MAG: CPBP family intramembrane metalloprotease [Moraxellaceae bacterium]|nr:MAG: CPBP family intramembrane metalloprotease [Moraxellaceae bacterium]
MAGLLIGNVVALLVLSGVYGFSLADLGSVISNPQGFPDARGAIVLYQGIVSVFAFLGGPLLLIKLSEKSISDYLSPNRFLPLAGLLLTGLLIIAFMPANSVVINWNTELDLPNFGGFETWARTKEEQLKVLTEYLTSFSTIPQLLLGLVVFAAIPAIGEEILFRGIVQRQLIRWVKNKHVAVWVAAFVFSFIHMQFLGLFPRMLLGALLGYLYLWSGNIWVPIFGHFVNNGFTVLMLYLRQMQLIEFEIESTQQMPVVFVIVSILLSAALLWLVKRLWRPNSAAL